MTVRFYVIVNWYALWSKRYNLCNIWLVNIIDGLYGDWQFGYMFLCVLCLCMLLMQVQCGYQILPSFRMQPATRMSMEGASNRRHVLNKVCLVLVPQWPHPVIQSVIHALKVHLRLLCNGRHATLSTSPISATVAPASNPIGDVRPESTSRITL
jgi:hypothetical protein